MDHPNHKRHDFKGTHWQIIEQLCEVYPYIVEVRGAVPNDWFNDNVKHEFCISSRGDGVNCVFFVDLQEAAAAKKRFDPNN